MKNSVKTQDTSGRLIKSSFEVKKTYCEYWKWGPILGVVFIFNLLLLVSFVFVVKKVLHWLIITRKWPFCFATMVAVVALVVFFMLLNMSSKYLMKLNHGKDGLFENASKKGLVFGAQAGVVGSLASIPIVYLFAWHRGTTVSGSLLILPLLVAIGCYVLIKKMF